MHLGIVFPGGGYGHEHPLLWFARNALRDVGAHEVLIAYEPYERLDDLEDLSHPFYGGIRRDVSSALATFAPSRVTLVGKSLGTMALGEVVRSEAIPAATALWLTPIWQHAPTFAAARSCEWESLYAVGTADPTFVPSLHAELRGATVVVDGGDHALQVAGDVLGSISALEAVTAAFVRHLGGAGSS